MNEQMVKKLLHYCNETAGLYLTKQCSTQIELAHLNWRTHEHNEQNNRPFSIIVDSEFTESNKVLNLLLESLNRSSKICSMVHKRIFLQENVHFLSVLTQYISQVDSLSSSPSIVIYYLCLNIGNVLQTEFWFRLFLRAMHKDHFAWWWWGFCVR